MSNVSKNTVIYQAKSGAIALKGDIKAETLWATQNQIVQLFNVHQSVISRHIRNVFKDGEIDQKSNMQKMHIASSDKPVMLYSLDVVLSVGYRANSTVAIEFRKWATKTLKQHITKGYTINAAQVVKNYEVFLQAVDSTKQLLSSAPELKVDDVLELVKAFASTWFSLDAYDRTALPGTGITKKKIHITASQFQSALTQLKAELLAKKEATPLFAKEKQQGSVEGIIGSVFQSFDGEDLYPTLEAKAAQLFYFLIKSHPFVDGNKRSAAFALVWFLRKAKLLDVNHLNPQALTALTLLVAESNPKEKERMIGLVLMLLKG